MLLQSATWRPMFKVYSPMSVGAWTLLAFGAVALLSFLGARRETGKWAVLRPPGALGVLVSVLGGFFGAFLAGYTGVLLSVTNRPIWADTSLLGLVFLVSGASTSAALLMLLGGRRSDVADTGRALARLDRWMLVLELVVLVALVASLGVVARAWLDAWGALLAVGVVGVGILAPLLLYGRDRGAAGHGVLASVLVLVGGLLLRASWSSLRGGPGCGRRPASLALVGPRRLRQPGRPARAGRRRGRRRQSRPGRAARRLGRHVHGTPVVASAPKGTTAGVMTCRRSHLRRPAREHPEWRGWLTVMQTRSTAPATPHGKAVAVTAAPTGAGVAPWLAGARIEVDGAAARRGPRPAAIAADSGAELARAPVHTQRGAAVDAGAFLCAAIELTRRPGGSGRRRRTRRGSRAPRASRRPAAARRAPRARVRGGASGSWLLSGVRRLARGCRGAGPGPAGSSGAGAAARLGHGMAGLRLPRQRRPPRAGGTRLPSPPAPCGAWIRARCRGYLKSVTTLTARSHAESCSRMATVAYDVSALGAGAVRPPGLGARLGVDLQLTRRAGLLGWRR
jgi:hypothetical protein